jgi:hypothetical protein
MTDLMEQNGSYPSPGAGGQAKKTHVDFLQH